MRTLPTLAALLLQSSELDPTVLNTIEKDALYAYAPSTVESLRAAYKDYPAWCSARNLEIAPLSLENALLYYHDRSQVLGPQAIRNRRKIITLIHRYFGLTSINDHPLVRMYLLARLRDAQPAAPKEAFTPDDIRSMMRVAEEIKEPFQRTRDLALLPWLFSCAGRAGETAAALANSIAYYPDHISWTIPRSKTDQYNVGYTLFIGRAADPRFCPIERMRSWRELYQGKHLFCRVSRSGTEHSDGLTTQGIAIILKSYAKRIGLDATEYAGHSMRSGFVTAGYARDVPEDDMRSVTRQSLSTLRKYNRKRQASRVNLTEAMGL